MHFDIKTILILIFLYMVPAFAGPGRCQDKPLELYDSALKRSKHFEEIITLPEISREAAGAAQKTADYFNSAEHQKKLDNEKVRIGNELFYLPYDKSSAEKSNQLCEDKLSASERIYLFISSSVPHSTLRTYARDLAILDDPHIAVVLRGFVHGMKLVKPTLDFIQGMVLLDANCQPERQAPCETDDINIQIDPLVFRKFNIQSVPALAYIQGMDLRDPMQSIGMEGNLKQEINAVILHGDISLSNALEKIYKKIHSPQLLGAIQRLRKDGFYETN